MKVKISGHQLEITDGIHQHTVEKLQKLKRHFDRPVDISVIMSVEKLNQIADFHLHAMGKDFHVRKSANELYVAIDEAVQVLDLQVQKQKNKLKNGRRSDKHRINSVA